MIYHLTGRYLDARRRFISQEFEAARWALNAFNGEVLDAWLSGYSCLIVLRENGEVIRAATTIPRELFAECAEPKPDLALSKMNRGGSPCDERYVSVRAAVVAWLKAEGLTPSSRICEKARERAARAAGTTENGVKSVLKWWRRAERERVAA